MTHMTTGKLLNMSLTLYLSLLESQALWIRVCPC